MDEPTYGSGDYGDTATPLPSMPVRITAKTGSTVYLAWNAYPGAAGYQFYRNGQPVSRSFNKDLISTHFSYIPGDVLGVHPFMLKEVAIGTVKL